MDEQNWLAERFEANRGHLRAVAYRMLGSLSEADDAVQETWLRLGRSETSGIANLDGWLTTVVARVCLDMLRARKSRREDPLDTPHVLASATADTAAHPAHEAMLADSVGLALLVVLDTLNPAERIAFVLHDLFAMPFDEVAAIVDRTPAAARQLASRARRRVQGAPPPGADELVRQREVIARFIAALRSGDYAALFGVLDPDVVVRTGDREVRGADALVQAAPAYRNGARHLEPALIDGALGIVLKRSLVLRLTFAGDRLARIEAISGRAEIAALEISTAI